MDEEALRRILKELRSRIAPEEVGLNPKPTGRPGPRVSGLSQPDMDILMNRAVGTYHRFESGKMTPRDDYLRQVGQILRLTEDEFTQVYLLCLGQRPPHSLDPGDGVRMAAAAAWQRAVSGQREIAYVNNVQWDLVAYNQPFTDIFEGGTPPENTMRWMALADEARDYILTDWETRWAPGILNQIRLAHIQRPENHSLAQLHRDVIRDKYSGPIYERSTEVYIHPDGDVRPLYHPKRGPGHITMVVSEPASSRGARHVVLLFDPVSEDGESAESGESSGSAS
ncbi:MmyB family transcriptional regulator [Streptomyces lasiicapitis]|uniref:MmyB family transcriptional regulator n=1 Tax=Streptomyces lasiicapitis TaxID=1923961 RepID=UPI00364C482A